MDIKLEFSFFLVYICMINGISAALVDVMPPLILENFNEGPVFVGGNLTLRCTAIRSNYNLDENFKWKTPNPFDPLRMHTHEERIPHCRLKRVCKTLIIYYTLRSDSGTYGCSFGNINYGSKRYRYASRYVEVFNLNEDSLDVYVMGNTSKTVSTGQPSVEWIVEVKGHPDPKVEWLNNKYNVIKMENGSKYEMRYNRKLNIVLLKIKNIDLKDSGNFTFTATNGKRKSIIFFLNVTGKPTAVLDVKPFYIINSVNTVKCLGFANPEPEIQWYSKSCNYCDYKPINTTVTTSEGYKYESAVTINVTESGYLKCFIRNNKGNSSDMKKFYVSDVENGFNIYSLDKDVDINKEVVTIIEGDTVTIICCASIYTYYGIQWLFNGIALENSQAGYRIRNITTRFSTKIELELQHANIFNSGFYSCRVTDNQGKTITLDKTFRVESPQVPKIINSSLQQDILFLKLHDKLELYCKCSGFPIPILTWYKDGKSVQKTNNASFENNEYLIIWNTTLRDAGTYKCEATNRLGSAVKQQTVQFLKSMKIDPQQTDHGWTGWLVSVVLGLVSIGVIIFIAIKIRKDKLLQRELKKLGLANFQKGAVKNINPGLGIGEQAELLPYYKKWEFPKERLQLGKQLGSGAFGVVMEGIAKNIVRGEDETKVAVKMVKRNADHTYIRILASELKIMVHLGKHLNVVNLLGACTKSVTKKELLIIVEYCRFGNLQNYLLRHRATFIDQIDQETGNIDYAIDQELLECPSAESCGEGSNQLSSHSYAELIFSNNEIVEPLTGNEDHQTDTTVSEDESETTSDSKSNSNFKENHKNNVTTICTKDLLSWSFQVARGMEYLASRKVLHGDLAARNILLAENNVVKICDFGLAKNMYMYTNVNYTKKGNSPLPVKWMAIESIRDRIFSTQSDVWSFGILLWEFFSMGETPYPGIEVDERLYQKLLEGYRMESPQFASREVYKLMTECWSHEPTGRPSFSTLSVELGCLLEDPVKQHYIDLNDPYLLMNTQQLKDQTDYLALLNPPTFELLSTPHQTIDMIDQKTSENDQQTGGIISCKSIKEGSTIDSTVNNLNLDEKNATKVSYTSKNEYVDL